MNDPLLHRQLQLLAERLERLSADSYWAHQASGLRGSLLRALDGIERGHTLDPAAMQRLADRGFFILEQAARERDVPVRRV